MKKLSTLVGELALLQVEDDLLKAKIERTKRDIQTRLEKDYPEEVRAWERGVRSITAEGVQVPVVRKYNLDKLKAEFGEERPDLIREEYEEVVVRPAREDGNKIKALWSDAGLARRLEQCLLQPPALFTQVKLKK